MNENNRNGRDMGQKRIAIIGEQCSGKSTVAKMAAKKVDSFIIKFADPIYEALASLNKNKHRAFMQEYGDLAKKHFGPDIFVQRFHERLRSYRFADMLVCDDVRIPIEAQAVKRAGFKIIYIMADRDVRKARAAAQGLEFIENHNSENQVAGLKDFVDLTIVNDGSEIGGLARVVDTALARLNVH